MCFEFSIIYKKKIVLLCFWLIDMNFLISSECHVTASQVGFEVVYIFYICAVKYCLTKFIALFRSNKQCYGFIYVYSMNILSMNVKECKIILLCKTYDIRPPGLWTTPVASRFPERFRRFGTAEGRVIMMIQVCFYFLSIKFKLSYRRLGKGKPAKSQTSCSRKKNK